MSQVTHYLWKFTTISKQPVYHQKAQCYKLFLLGNSEKNVTFGFSKENMRYQDPGREANYWQKNLGALLKDDHLMFLRINLSRTKQRELGLKRSRLSSCQMRQLHKNYFSVCYLEIEIPIYGDTVLEGKNYVRYSHNY